MAESEEELKSISVVAHVIIAYFADVIIIGIYAEGDPATVAYAIVVLVSAHILAAKVAIMTLVNSVCAIGELVTAFVAHMICIVIYTHFHKASVAYAVRVFICTHASAALVTVVAAVLTVNTKTVATVVTVVILVLAVGTSAENLFTYVA